MRCRLFVIHVTSVSLHRETDSAQRDRLCSSKSRDPRCVRSELEARHTNDPAHVRVVVNLTCWIYLRRFTDSCSATEDFNLTEPQTDRPYLNLMWFLLLLMELIKFTLSKSLYAAFRFAILKLRLRLSCRVLTERRQRAHFPIISVSVEKWI